MLFCIIPLWEDQSRWKKKKKKTEKNCSTHCLLPPFRVSCLQGVLSFWVVKTTPGQCPLLLLLPPPPPPTHTLSVGFQGRHKKRQDPPEKDPRDPRAQADPVLSVPMSAVDSTVLQWLRIKDVCRSFPELVNNTTTHVVRIHGTEQYLHYKGWLNETGVQRDHGQSPAVRVTCQFYSGVETPYHHFRGQLLAFPIRFEIKVARLMSEEGEECVCVVVPYRATGASIDTVTRLERQICTWTLRTCCAWIDQHASGWNITGTCKKRTFEHRNIDLEAANLKISTQSVSESLTFGSKRRSSFWKSWLRSAWNPGFLVFPRPFKLSWRRRRFKLLLLWKLLNGEGPPSLFAKVPPLVECRGMQMLRRRTIEVPLCRTERRLRSFLPSTIQLWNSLPVYITSSSTSSTFLSALDSFLLKDKYSFGLV